MTTTTDRARLIDAARALHQRGLVARTWGNLSLRVDDKSFLITPSGRTYETMSADDLASVTLANGHWNGPLKPSSEMGLHARVYRRRPEVGAVIHTHQPAASSLAAARAGFTPTSEEDRERLGGTVPCVPYALPTTRRLARFAEKTAAESRCRALLLSNHGALCLGKNIEDALQVAMALEHIAEKEILARFKADATRVDLLEDYAPRSSTIDVDESTERRLLGKLRRSRHRWKRILVHKGEYLSAAARAGKTIYPMVDDLAQLIGPTLPIIDVGTPFAATRLSWILRRRNAVLVPGLGCLCVGKDDSEVEATAMVAEKGCRVAIESSYLGGGHKISRPETLLMRFIFVAKYSKKAAG